MKRYLIIMCVNDSAIVIEKIKDREVAIQVAYQYNADNTDACIHYCVLDKKGKIK